MSNILDDLGSAPAEFNNNSDFDFLVPSKTLGQFSFNQDLLKGKEGEKYVKKILTEAAIEVKRDGNTIKTGNICIEFECRGKPSGISVTKALFWCFIMGDRHVLMLSTDFLKWIIKNNFGENKWMGDTDPKTGKKVAHARLVHWKVIMTLLQQYHEEMGM